MNAALGSVLQQRKPACSFEAHRIPAIASKRTIARRLALDRANTGSDACSVTPIVANTTHSNGLLTAHRFGIVVEEYI